MTKMNPVEGDVKAKIKALLKKHGWFTFMPASNTYGGNGVSDHLALKNGVFFAIEAKLKTAKGGTKENPRGTPLQEQFLQKVRDHGGYGMVVNAENLGDFEKTLIRLGELPSRMNAALT